MTAEPELVVRTFEIDDPGPLLALLPGADVETDTVAWVRHGDGMVGWGEAARHKPQTIADAQQWWSELCASVQDVGSPRGASVPPGSGLVAFGSFVFDPANTSAASSFLVPGTVVGRRGGRSWCTRVGTREELGRGPDVVPASATSPHPPREVAFADGALTAPQWETAVARAVAQIDAGALHKVVLARDLVVTSVAAFDVRWLATRLAADYPTCWTYLVDGLVGASPEMLVRREAGLVTSRVLAGTIRRSGDGDLDLRLAASLARSSKDHSEHGYAVRSVARALAPYCSGMNVPDAPYVLALPNVLHLATDVTAAADAASTALDLAGALHPSAAVCGTPTDAARALIAELEHLDRERYAGPVGWIDARGDGEWAIALRCGQVDETDARQIRLFAGCGIVAGSDPEAELAESNAKLIPMRDAVSAAEATAATS